MNGVATGQNNNSLSVSKLTAVKSEEKMSKLSNSFKNVKKDVESSVEIVNNNNK